MCVCVVVPLNCIRKAVDIWVRGAPFRTIMDVLRHATLKKTKVSKLFASSGKYIDVAPDLLLFLI